MADHLKDTSQIRLFAGTSNAALAQRVAEYLGVALSRGKVERFPDGETLVKVEEDVRGRDCYVLQSTCAPAN